MTQNGKAVGGSTIFRLSLLLAIGSSLALALCTIVIILFGPAPVYFPMSTFEVARALQGMPIARRGEPIDIWTAPEPPQSNELSSDPINRIIRENIARQMNIPADDVVFVLQVSLGSISDPMLAAARSRYREVLITDAALYPDSPAFAPLIFGPFVASVKQPDGQWRTLSSSSFDTTAHWQLRFAGMIALVFALTVPPVWLYSRRLARPIRSFAAASDRIGRGNFEKLPVKGPNEIRVAALAMNDMQDRLERFVRERTAMAGAIAHDLRTPMARLAFLLNRLPEEQRRPLEHELSNMDRMISVTLDFVDSEAAIPTRDAIDLTLLVEGLIDDFADRGLDTSLSLPQTSAPIVVTGDQVLLTRMFNNLITNALTYGQCARASIWTENDQVIVEVTDKGPGMEATDIERAFEPFYRAERSRSTATGGVGLGLSIVQAVARSHQGTVSLRNAPAGGLIARVTLPLSERDAAQSEQRVTPSLRA